MRTTLRSALAGATALALLSGLATAALAQSDDGGSGLVEMESTVDLGWGDEVDGTYWFASEAEASDPRLSGRWTENWRCQPGTGFEMCVGTVHVENEGGMWLGRAEGFNLPNSAFEWTVLEGQDGYAGLTATRLVTEKMDQRVEEMAILDFEMPAQPEHKMPELPADLPELPAE